MKKHLVISAILMAGFFVSCGDDSTSMGPDEELSSSLVVKSSSSIKAKSSSSKLKSSSSVKAKSSSSVKAKSSSAVVVKSSSSVTAKSSSAVAKSSSSVTAKSSSAVVKSSSSAQPKSSSVTPKSSSVVAKSSSSVKPVSSSSVITHVFGVLEDKRNNKKYRTIEIEGITWMADNLDIEYKDSAGEVKSFCYGDDVKNCEKYGRLYTWAAAIDSAGLYSDDGWGCGLRASCAIFPVVQGVCPDGWHLPTEEEFETLMNATSDGIELQALGFENWDMANNLSGFSAVPSGSKSFYDGYEKLGELAVFWAKNTAVSGAVTFNIDGNKYAKNNWMHSQEVHNGASVRCAKNTSPRPVIKYGSLTDERDGQKYKTVEIEGRYWMAQNLNYGDKYEKIMPTLDKEGNPMPIEYGKLYTWGIAMDTAGYFSAEAKDCGYGIDCSSLTHARGICPKGWHLPDSTEWESLLAYAKSFEFDFEYQSFHLQTRKLEEWPKASNRTGFSAVPSGSWGDTDEYWSISNDHYPSDGTVAPSRALFLYLATNQVRIDWSYKDKYKAVRCVEN